MANKLYIGNSVLVDLSNYYTKSETDTAISNVDVSDQLDDYVQKDGSKVLSDNNFTDALKTKLEGLSNFDPTNINSAISAIQSTLGDITGDGAAVTAALDTWNEIKAFVSDYTNTGDLQDLINTTTSNIQTWVGNQGFLTSTAAASTYQPKFNGTPVVINNNNGVVIGGDGTASSLTTGASIAAGYLAMAANAQSFAFGNYVETNAPFGAVFGNHNRQNTGDVNYVDGTDVDTYGTDNNPLFVIGNGFNNGELEMYGYQYIGDYDPEDPTAEGTIEDAWHNAFEVMQSGKIYVADTTASGEFYEKPMVCLQTELKKASTSVQNGGGVNTIKKLTQAAFNALATKDANTLYIVEDNA